MSVVQVAGSTGAFEATEPSRAHVLEIPDVEVEMRPLFVHGAQRVLWGRKDFMARFEVTFTERRQQFSINPMPPP